MKRFTSMLLLLIVVLSGCSQNSNITFKVNEKGNLVDSSGTEYYHLAYEGVLHYLGELEQVGDVQGDSKLLEIVSWYGAGMFGIKGSENDNVMIRRIPDNEWYAIYRKTSLPAFDYSVDNCIRLELIKGTGNPKDDAIHVDCGDGITDSSEISSFLSDVRSQKSAREAGLYDLIKKSDGFLENCYTYGIIYGFFEDEPNIVIIMTVTSYNDLAYSVSIEGKEYVLPNKYIEYFHTSDSSQGGNQ